MTQQPVYQQPPVQYAPQAPPVQYAPQPYAPQPQAYAQPVYQQAPPAPAGPPPVQGTLDDYYSQPTGGGGPGISWKGKPEGTSYIGTVTKDVTNGDIIQDSDFTTKQPKFYKDGRPVFVMRVGLVNAPTQEFPDGEFSFWVRGQARDELSRAMAEAGVEGAPKAGDVIQVTLVQRKPNRTGNPTNIVQISYTPNPNAAAPVAVQAPVAAAIPVAQVPVAVAPVTVQQPVQVPVAQAAPVAQAPAQQVLQGVPGMTQEQLAKLAEMTGQQVVPG